MTRPIPTTPSNIPSRWWLPLALLLVCGAALAQDSAPADSVKLGQGAEGAPELTLEEKISSLNAKVLQNPADHRAWNDLGVVYATEGRDDLARDAFIKAIQANPQEADYHRNLGLIFSRLEMHDMAVAEFEAYRRFDQLGGMDFWRLIGGAQFKAGRVDDARVTLQEGIDLFKPSLGAEGLRLVMSLKELEDSQGNEQAVRDLLKEHAPAAETYMRGTTAETDGYDVAQAVVQSNVAVMVEDAKLMESSGLLTEAAALYSQAYDTAPERDDLLPRLVSVYLDADQVMDAKVAARLARTDHPNKAGTWIATGKVYENTNRLEEAAEAYQKAYELDSSITDLRVTIGNLLMRLGRDQEASEYFRAGVNAADTKPEVVYNYAVSLMREKKYHAAIPSLRNVVRQRPDMAPAWIALAQALQATKQYSQAVEPYQKAIELNPDPKLYFHLAHCSQRAKKYDIAIENYGLALENDPGYVKARYNLSLTLMDAGRYEEAVESFNLMLELEPESYRVYYSMGLSHFYLEQYDEALEAYDFALEQKETVNVLNNIGLVYDKLGDKKKAAAYYKDAAALKAGG